MRNSSKKIASPTKVSREKLAIDDPKKKKSSPGAAKKSATKPAARVTKTSSKPISRSSSRSTSKTKPSEQGQIRRVHISADRKADILGAILALGGLFLGLMLFSVSRSPVTEGLAAFFDQLIGHGVYALPLGMIWVGGWLILRRIESIPNFSIGKVVGAIFAFFGFLSATEALTLHGGLIGKALWNGLLKGLGELGAGILLGAWLVIALMLLFNINLFQLLLNGAELLGTLFRRVTGKLFQSRDQYEDEQLAYQDGYLPVEADEEEGKPQPHVIIERQVEVGKPVRLEPNKILWKLPRVKDILNENTHAQYDEELTQERVSLLESTLRSFSAPGKVVNIERGPTVTQFGVEPQFVETRNGRVKVRVNKIAALADDLALALSAASIRIQAPVPGHSYVGIEVPNGEMSMVDLRGVLESDEYQRKRKPLSFGLGRSVSGRPISADLAAMPHLLIAGATGSGKSVCVNALLSSLLMFNTPDDLRLVLVDPKRVELTGYNGIPHLLAPVIVETDRVLGALQWMTREMDRRYHTFADVGARNIDDYNSKARSRNLRNLPNIVVVIDELADLMMIAPEETERTVTRLAQLARATGIHLVLATQRPSVNVVTGLIKANIPARVAFAVTSNTDSRVILDKPGAERLLGKGDMLYQDPNAPEPVRLQGVYVSDIEIQNLVDYWRDQAAPGQAGQTDEAIDRPGENLPLKQTSYLAEDITARDVGDPLTKDAMEFVRAENKASVSMLQRKFRIGYTRASRIIDSLEEKGVVGAPKDGSGIRPVLSNQDEAE